MNIYTIKKTKKIFSCDDSKWDEINALNVDCFPWGVNGYKPNTIVRIVYSDLGFCVKMETDETPLLARFTEDNSLVCKDSCMEFFFGGNQTGDYLNFEFNPNGAMLLGVGDGRENRTLINFDRDLFDIESAVSDGKWALKFFIPFEFSNQYFAKPIGVSLKHTTEFYGNFYKCGDETDHPHWGCWNKIATKQPDFHQPEFFGKFILLQEAL